MSEALDRLTAEVAKITSVDESVVATVKGMADQIRANATDQTALLKLADDMDAQATTFATAVSTSTAAATPTPAPAPDPAPAPAPDPAPAPTPPPTPPAGA